MFTNGVARYLRRTKFAEYNEFAEASAEISWSAVDRPAEAEHLAAQAAKLAKAQVEQQLGIGKPAESYGRSPAMDVLPETKAVIASDRADIIANVEAATVTAPAVAIGNDKAALAATMTNGGSGEIMTGVPAQKLREAFGTGRKPKSATQVVEADPADMGPVNPPAAAHTVSSASAAPTSSLSTVGPNLMSEPTPVEIWQGTPAAKTYTVAELGRACADALLRLKSAGDPAPSVTITDLVGKFGKATNAIPEDKRAEFLAELALLEPRK